MSLTVTVPQEVILNKIFVIRKQKVMLDKDIASLYDIETLFLNQAVRSRKIS